MGSEDLPGGLPPGAAGAARSLPCGTPRDRLREMAVHPEQPRPEHAHSCHHCAAVLAELDRRWRAVDEADPAPGRLPAGVAERVVRRLRAEIHRGQGVIAVAVPGPGSTVVRPQVVARLAEDAAARSPQVRHVAAWVQDAGLRMQVVAVLGVELPALVDRLRADVLTTLALQVGDAVDRVDIEIVDLDIEP
jgi:hypothetical protein